MRNFKFILIFILFIGVTHSSYSQGKVLKAVYVAAKNGLGTKPLKLLGLKTISKKTFSKSFTSLGGNLAKKTKLADKLTEADLLKWLKSSGYRTKAAQTNINRIGIKNLKKIYANLDANAPYNVKKVIIDDFRDNPKVMTEILDDTKLLKSYSKVLAMGPKYRRSKTFLTKVTSGKEPINIPTTNSNLEGKVIEGVKYVRKVVEIPNSGGLKVVGVFPDFKGFSIFKLPIMNKLLKSDNEQFNYAFRVFQENLRRNKNLQKQFTPNQLKELLTRKVVSAKSKSTHIVPGYTWHHTEDGALQLVKTEIHDAVKHTGGRSLIGGGDSLRYRNVDDLTSLD